MKRIRFGLFALLLVFGVSTTLTGCSSAPPEEEAATEPTQDEMKANEDMATIPDEG